MTMPRGASRALYTGNGQAAEFPFFFKVFEEDQLSVFVTSPSGVTSEAAGWSAELDEGGGTVRYLHNGAPLPEGWKLAIMRDMPFVQEVDLITGTRFDPEVIETALDVATAERQQLLERLARAVVVEPTDEAGPDALLADIRDARTSAAASAGSAQASATAAAESARAAAGSAAIATEEREAACVCAGEARAARDVAIAQTEAANILMEAELAKVNAIVAANKTDQQAAVTAARAWAEKAPDVPVEYDEDGNPRYSARHYARNAQENAIHPDNKTVMVDADGLLSALGGNLLLNDEIWITESGDFEVPYDGVFELLIIDGGNGAFVRSDRALGAAGDSGNYGTMLVHLKKGDVVSVTIGAGGVAQSAPAGSSVTVSGGKTYFGGYSAGFTTRFKGETKYGFSNAEISGFGGGFGGGLSNNAITDGKFYGAGGGFYSYLTTNLVIGNGKQGVVRLRGWNPAKVGGDSASPATFTVSRSRARAAAKPATVNLYDPETGQGSVWREEDAEAQLARGLISEAAWLEICTAKAAGERAAWLASPETEAERFDMLRAARDAKLAATDYLVAPDYPLTDDGRAAVTAYRQALRDLPAGEGAPWDGGGDATPWPAMPAAEADEEGAGGDAPCA